MKQFYIIQIVSEMKSSTNKFDYPTAASHTYKMFKQEQPKNHNEEHRQRYKEYTKEQRDIQRMKVKQEQQRKVEAERRQNKKKIQEEIQNKKKELLDLEKARNLAIEEEKKSQELALVRQEEERLMKIQKQRRSKENQFHAQNRFLEALQRLESENQIKQKKEKEAAFRRKAIEEAEKIERDKAIKFREELQEKQRQIKPEEKRSFRDYKQPLGRTAYNKTVDYNRTFLHNPTIILPNGEEAGSAMEKAEAFNEKVRERSQERKARQEQNRRISMERGQAAMNKIKLQKEYEEYQRQAEARQINYNMERIQLGKKNQYIGVKPSTLMQMQANKRQRCEEDFQKMFFGGSSPQWFDRQANQYHIMGARLGQTEESKSEEVKKKPIALKSLGSLEPAISDGHYSFEEGSLNDLTTVKKNNADENAVSRYHEQSGGLNPIEQYEERKANMHNSNNRQELSYSESEDSFV